MFTSVRDRADIAKTLSNMGLPAAARNAIEEALALFQQALDEYREIGDRHGERIAEDNIRLLSAEKGRSDGEG